MLGRPCCHLWSFYGRQVIYRNLSVQSQYLPVGAVKIYNSSVPLACRFPVDNGNFHHQEERPGVATRATLPPSRQGNEQCYWLQGKCTCCPSGHWTLLLCCEDKRLSGQKSGIVPVTSLWLKLQRHPWLKPKWHLLPTTSVCVCVACVCMSCVCACMCVHRCAHVCAFQRKTDTYSQNGGGVVFHRKLQFPSEIIRTPYFSLKIDFFSTSLIILFSVFCEFTFICTSLRCSYRGRKQTYGYQGVREGGINWEIGIDAHTTIYKIDH